MLCAQVCILPASCQRINGIIPILIVSLSCEEQPVTMVMITMVMITITTKTKGVVSLQHTLVWCYTGYLRSVMCSEKFPHFQPVILTCLLASTPTSLSPSLVKATTEGVVLDPSAFSITLGILPSITATHELVVPRSIPITVPFTSELRGRTEERAVMNTGAQTANVDSFLALHPHFDQEQ